VDQNKCCTDFQVSKRCDWDNVSIRLGKRDICAEDQTALEIWNCKERVVDACVDESYEAFKIILDNRQEMSKVCGKDNELLNFFQQKSSAAGDDNPMVFLVIIGVLCFGFVLIGALVYKFRKSALEQCAEHQEERYIFPENDYFENTISIEKLEFNLYQS
jgi:cbb3-type cytochrome oxidase subunit 3